MEYAIDKNSIDFIINILKENKNMKQVNWFSILGYLSVHRIAGLFYSKAKKMKINLPMIVDKQLEEINKKQKRRIDYLNASIKELAIALNNNNIEYVFLKGSVFSNSNDTLNIYNKGERSSNDIDILVTKKNIENVKKVLSNLGYIQGKYNKNKEEIIPFTRGEIIKRRMTRGEIAPFIKKTDNAEFEYVEIDINYSLGNTTLDYLGLLEEMIQTRKKYQNGIYGLNHEMFLIQLLLHQYKEKILYFMIERSKDIQMYKLVDIYYLLKNNSIDFNKFKIIVEKNKLEYIVGTILYEISEIFDDEEVKKLSEKFKIESSKIINYDTKQTFKFTKPIKDRIRRYSNIDCLEEI